MLSFRPPNHRIDAPIIFIHPTDDAWDRDRYEADIEKLRESGEDPGQHPLSQYFGGLTRYDLDAPAPLGDSTVSARSFLKPESQPTKWYLKRLPPLEYYELRGMWEAEIQKQTMRPRSSYYRAAITGIDKVENGPELEGGGGRKLTPKDVRTLHDCCASTDDLLLDIGEAVFVVSMPLSGPEKKP